MRPLARDYTPTRFDAKAREHDLEIVLQAGDETVLPAIARWLRELPAGTQVHAFIEVNDSRDENQEPHDD